MRTEFDGSPAWFQWALHDIGIKERPGRGSTARILEYRTLAQIPLKGDDSDVPWCAIFVNAALESCGIKGSRSGMARSFIHSKQFVRLEKASIGAITVFSSPRGPSTGHVGFYRGEGAKVIYVLGGNQGDKVSIAPFTKARLLGHFWPASLPLPVTGPIKFDAGGSTPSDK